MNEITLVFTTQELDYICNTLAQRPWGEVNGLLAKIQNQANAQPIPLAQEAKTPSPPDAHPSH